MLHPKLYNINPHNVTHSLISCNPKERMFVVQISLLIVTFFSLISWILSLMQTTKQVNPHPRIKPRVNMWSVFFFFFLCHLLNVGGCICHITREGSSGADHTTPLKCCTLCLFHNVTCYTNSIVSRIHVTTTELRNITCTWVTPGYDTTEFKVYNIIDCVFTLDNVGGGAQLKEVGAPQWQVLKGPGLYKEGRFLYQLTAEAAPVGPTRNWVWGVGPVTWRHGSPWWRSSKE